MESPPGLSDAHASPGRAWSEEGRLAALAACRVLGVEGGPAFDEITRLACLVCNAPVGLISLVGRERQWFLSETGFGTRQTGLDSSICASALHHEGVFVVTDLSQDPRYAGMEIVTGPRRLRFYAGAAVRTPEGLPLGMLCVFDTEPRPDGLTKLQEAMLTSLARQAALQLNLRQREDEIEQGRAALIRFFNRAPVGLLQADLEGRVTYINRHYAELLGVSPSQMFGKRLADRVHPDDAEAHASALARALGGEDGVVLEKRYVTPSGAEAWSSDHVTVTRDTDGKPLNVVFVSRDITERLRITAQLAASERKFRAIADTMPQMVWSTLPDGAADYYNQRWYDFTGVPIGTHDGDAWNRAVHPDDRERALARWRLSVEGGEPYEIEYRLRHHSGEYRWVLGRALPVLNMAGQIERWFGTCTDIEDIKRSEEARNLLAHELSHRIKNIFAVVSGLVSLTSRGDEAARPFAQSFRERLNALSMAHEYVRPGEGGAAQAEGLSVFGLMRMLLRPYEGDGRERYRFNGDDPEIGAKTATALALVMHEQATNAVKYGALANEGGQVLIEGAVDGDTYVLRWREMGGPPVEGPPERRGFGTDMASRSAAGQLGGTILHDWARDGLVVTLVIPLANLAR
ncbi:MAG: PAS domain S-box protein [Alphaproteobacteria bacterium]|nr:PAS domain S-box protein [Alphaproteobacteria bacterium]